MASVISKFLHANCATIRPLLSESVLLSLGMTSDDAINKRISDACSTIEARELLKFLETNIKLTIKGPVINEQKRLATLLGRGAVSGKRISPSWRWAIAVNMLAIELGAAMSFSFDRDS